MNRNLIHQLQRLPIIFNEYCFSNQGLDLDLLTRVERSLHDAYRNMLYACYYRSASVFILAPRLDLVSSFNKNVALNVVIKV